ncbi:HDAC6 [Branchiostoma lanceolatum]|uniref:HDAC6 protein n=1 Tax=Branchiostoma lanceolatum TaxID=7740 RepID=A0A8J9VHF8_BRALA|nr:HDAC6 [Branchiostoma lanceolatum]
MADQQPSGSGDRSHDHPPTNQSSSSAAVATTSEEGAAGGAESASSTISDLIGGEFVFDNLFAVVPLPWCEHLETVATLPSDGLDVSAPCVTCGDPSENWVCLHCYQVHCGRFVKEHMVRHGETTGHCLVLSYADLSVWCYPCEAYVHNETLLPAKRAAHLSKFGCLPGC